MATMLGEVLIELIFSVGADYLGAISPDYSPTDITERLRTHILKKLFTELEFFSFFSSVTEKPF